MALTEFEVIARYFSDLGCQPSDKQADDAQLAIHLGVGDDCALLSLAANQQLALSIDTLIEGVHFPENSPANLIAQRALAVACSDLAAMGATPAAFTLALTLPEISEPWLKQFSQGLSESARRYGLRLIGGDTTRGTLSITIQVHGTLPKGESLKRATAEVGDVVFVSGTLGDAAAALAVLEKKLRIDKPHEDYLLDRFFLPAARTLLGQSLLGVASSAIDISDGLLADVGHIASASRVAVEIYASQLPISTALQAVVDTEMINRYALVGGDDYELCFTVAPEYREKINEFSALFDLPLTEVGRIIAGQGVSCLAANGDKIELGKKGYQHFNSGKSESEG